MTVELLLMVVTITAAIKVTVAVVDVVVAKIKDAIHKKDDKV